MRIRFFILGIVIFFISVILTGCTANIDVSDNSQQEKNTRNNSEFDIKDSKIDSEEYEGIYYDDSKYSYSYIDLGNKYYTIIYGLDDNQNVTWTYETPIANSEENSIWIDSYNDELIYVIDAGSLYALDMGSGEVKWRVEDENIIKADYMVREDGIIDIIFGEEVKRFISVDKNGTVLKNMDLSKYNSEVSDVYWYNSFQENELILTASSNDDFRDELKVRINLDNYEVTLDKIEYNDVTADLIVGKSISNGYYESYFFNNDGTVVISRDDSYEKFSVIRYTGTWTLEDGLLKIKVNEAVVAYNGDYITNEDGSQSLVNYDEKSIPADIERESKIYYCPNYQGSEKIYLNGDFYSFLEAVG